MSLVSNTVVDIFSESMAPLWLTKRHVVDFGRLYSNGQLEFRLSTGPTELYDYFPTYVHVTCNGQPSAILEFSGASETLTVTLDVVARPANLEVVFQCEQAKTPAAAGIGADERELGVVLSGLTFRPREVVEAYPEPLPVPVYMKHTLPAGDVPPEPVFVIGCYRSGTSILTWAVGQHPNIFPMEETNWLPSLCYGATAAFQRSQSASRSATVVYDLELDEFLQWQGSAIDGLHKALCETRAHQSSLERLSFKEMDFDPRFQLIRGRFAPKRRWVDGTPENTGVANILARMFPRSKFIYAIRSPAEVIGSLMRFDAAGGERQTFEQAAETWERFNQWGYEQLEHYGSSRVLLSPYEAMAQHPDQVLAQIWRFLREPAFPKSAETFQHRINSSSVQRGDLAGHEAHLERLQLIYDAIIQRAPFAAVPWTLPSSTADLRDHDIVSRLLQATSS